MFNNSVLPSSIDWRKKGAVSSVKSQGNCASCWAFSALAAIEGINKIKTGKWVSLSAQELVDCDVTTENQGCDGGFMQKAYEYILLTNGITTEEDYPYQGKQGTCDMSKAKYKAAKISGYVQIPPGDVTAIQSAVPNQPIAVAIDGSSLDFQFYSSGVFNGNCGRSLNHGVTIVGYDMENGVEYWLVKNSWGTTWGEEGYIKVKRGSTYDQSGTWGIALEASYPTKLS